MADGIISQGICPKCCGESLEFSGHSNNGGVYDNYISYEFSCDDCGYEGKELYELNYVETMEVK